MTLAVLRLRASVGGGSRHLEVVSLILPCRGALAVLCCAHQALESTDTRVQEGLLWQCVLVGTHCSAGS